MVYKLWKRRRRKRVVAPFCYFLLVGVYDCVCVCEMEGSSLKQRQRNVDDSLSLGRTRCPVKSGSNWASIALFWPSTAFC